MKTAMQELMDALNDLETVYLQNDWRREVIGINQAKNLIEYIYLKKEKEQMRLADKNGQDRNQYKHDCKYGGVEYWDNEPKSFEEYYNETFKQQEQ